MPLIVTRCDRRLQHSGWGCWAPLGPARGNCHGPAAPQRPERFTRMKDSQDLFPGSLASPWTVLQGACLVRQRACCASRLCALQSTVRNRPSPHPTRNRPTTPPMVAMSRSARRATPTW